MAIYRQPAQSSNPVVTTIMAACLIVYLMQASDPLWMIQTFALWPLGDYQIITPYGKMGPSFHLGQLVTSAFLHGGFMHLFFNMFALWMFGSQIERLWGSVRFTFYYFFCIVGASLLQLFVASIAAAEGAIYPTIGASGGVFGVLLAFGFIFPNQQIMLLFPPIPMKAKWFVIVMGAISLFAGITGTMGNVAHFAHLGGMIFGLILLLIWGWRPKRPWINP